MAVIDIHRGELDRLLGASIPDDRLAADGSMLGILFEPGDDGSISVEVEPNRPDLLSVEGVARALRGFFDIDPGLVQYPVADGDTTVTVEDAVEHVRPSIACARVTNLSLDQEALDSIIQLQEKLTETYGRKREKIAIGLHDFSPVTPPVTYTAVDPEFTFTPLDGAEDMTLDEILEEHEKGQEYGWIVEEHGQYPIIVDDDGEVLSFPPIINGVMTAVTTDTTDLFIDVTGTSQRDVETTLHIIVAALHERGGSIESVDVDGTIYPDMEPETLTVDPAYVRAVSGLDDLSVDGMKDALEAMNYDVVVDDELAVRVPAYRSDIMHPYDIIEDIVIGYGYDNVNPEIPGVATIGGLSERRVFIDVLRDHLVGAGAQECMTFTLSNREKLFDRMGQEQQPVVEMQNPLTEEYAVVRSWLLPSLLDVLASNTHNRYPQTLFEIGRCSELADTPTGAEDRYKLAYVTADDDAGFSTARSVLQTLGVVLGADIIVEEADDPSFAEKRCGTVLLNDQAVGVIGEVAETVRSNWDIDVPVAGFELDVARLRSAIH